MATEFDDLLDGTPEADLLFGAGGNDTIRGNGGHDDLNGGAGADLIEGGAGQDILFGGDDGPSGASDIDTLIGGDGDDYFWMGQALDNFIGGAGQDTLSTFFGLDLAETDRLFIDLANEVIRVTGSVSESAEISGIEVLDLTLANGIDVVGDDSASHIQTGFGNDVIAAGGGADVISGNGGNDTIDGGAGDDLVLADEGADVITLGAGADTIQGSLAELDKDRITDIELGDQIVVMGASFSIGDISFEDGTGRLWIDGNGDGYDDASFLLQNLTEGTEFNVVSGDGRTMIEVTALGAAAATAPPIVPQVEDTPVVEDSAPSTPPANAPTTTEAAPVVTAQRSQLLEAPFIAGDPEPVSLGSGPSVLIGTAEQIDGGVVSDFAREDHIVLSDAKITARDLFYDSGTGRLGFDIDGDGVADGTLTLQGLGAGVGFEVITGVKDTLIRLDTPDFSFREGRQIDPAEQSPASHAGFLTGDEDVHHKIKLSADAGADYQNAVGLYEVDANNQIVNVRILFDNVRADPNAEVTLTDLTDGHQMGLFIVQDGASWARGLSGDEELSFIDTGSGAVLAVDGVRADVTVFHGIDAALNVDGIAHAVSKANATADGVLIGFEDATGGGDFDYQDVLLEVTQIDAGFDPII